MTYTMNTGGIACCRSCVATAAIGRTSSHIVVWMLVRNVGVTTRAGVGLVDRALELCLIHEQRDLFTEGISFRQRLVPMTIQAGIVGAFIRGWQAYLRQRKECQL